MSHIFLVKDTAGSYLIHHGKPGQKWGERHGPPYPLSRQSETERKELKPGSKVLQGKEITNRRTLKKKAYEKATKFRDKKISKLEKKRNRLHDYNVDERKAINKEIEKYKKMSLEELDEKRKNAGKEFIQNLLENSTKGQQWGVRNAPSDATKQDAYKKEYEAGRQKFIKEYEKIRNTSKTDEEKDRRLRKLEDKWKEEGTKLLNKIDDPDYNKFKGKDTKFNGLAFKDSQDFQKQLKDRNLSDDDMKEYSNNKDAILKSLTGRGEKDPELAKEYRKYMKENGSLLDGAIGATIRTETFAEKKALEMLDKKKDTKFGGKDDSKVLTTQDYNKDREYTKKVADLGLTALKNMGEIKDTKGARDWFLYEDQTVGLTAVADLVNQGKSKSEIKKMLKDANNASYEQYINDAKTFNLSEASNHPKIDEFIDSCIEVKKKDTKFGGKEDPAYNKNFIASTYKISANLNDELRNNLKNYKSIKEASDKMYNKINNGKGFVSKYANERLDFFIDKIYDKNYYNKLPKKKQEELRKLLFFILSANSSHSHYRRRHHHYY